MRTGRYATATIYLSHQTKAEWVAYCKANRTSLSALIREAVEAKLQAEETKSEEQFVEAHSK